MRKVAGWSWVILAGILSAVQISAQTLSNQSLTGKYYFRHLSLGTDGDHRLGRIAEDRRAAE